MNTREEIQKLKTTCLSDELNTTKEETPTQKTKLKQIQISQLQQIKSILKSDQQAKENAFKSPFNAPEIAKNTLIGANIEKECQKLKQSLQKNSNQSTIIKQKQTDIDRLGKENHTSLTNQYKRAKESDKNLQDYQDKYVKLEENFKRFTDNLYQKRQNCQNSLNESIQYERSCSVSPIQGHNINKKINQSMAMVKEMNIIDQESMHDNILQELPITTPDSVYLKNYNKCSNKFNTLTSINNNNNSFLSLDINQNERLFMLKQLIIRMHQFIKLAMEKLITLSVSKHQEADLKEMLKSFNQSHKAQTLRIQNFCDNMRNNERDQEQIEQEQQFIDIECEHISQLFGQCLSLLSESFSKIMNRIYQVDSETFKNYKFKDALHLFEMVVQESHRLNFHEMLPNIASSILKVKLQASSLLIFSKIRQRDQHQSRMYFTKWRLQSGLKQYLTTQKKLKILSNCVERICQYSSKIQQIKLFNTWKIKSISTEMNQQIDNTILQELIQSHLNGEQKSMPQIFASISGIVYKHSQMTCEVCIYSQNNYIYIPNDYNEEQSINLSPFIENSITASLQNQICVNNLFSNRLFNENIDLPRIMTHVFQNANNQYCDELGLLIIPIENGILRFYKSSPFYNASILQIQKIGKAIELFFKQSSFNTQQIQQLLNQIESKYTENESLISFSKMQERILSISSKTDELEQADLILYIEEQFNQLLHDNLDKSYLRQIVFYNNNDSRSLLNEKEGQAIIRQKNQQEIEIEEDFLDYQQDRLIHQISIFHQNTHQNKFNFIIHRSIEKTSHQNQNEELQVKMLSEFNKELFLQFCKNIQFVLTSIVFKQQEFRQQIYQQSSLNDQKDNFIKAIYILTNELNFDQNINNIDLLSDIQGQYEKQINDILNLAFDQINMKTQSLEFYVNTNLIGETKELIISQGNLVRYTLSTIEQYEENDSENDIVENNEFINPIKKVIITQKTNQCQDSNAKEVKLEIPQQITDHNINIKQINTTNLFQIQIPITDLYRNVYGLIKIEVLNNNQDNQNWVDDLTNLLQIVQQKLFNKLYNIQCQNHQQIQKKQQLQQLDAEIQNLQIDSDIKQQIIDIFMYPLLQDPSITQLGKQIESFCSTNYNITPTQISLIHNDIYITPNILNESDNCNQQLSQYQHIEQCYILNQLFKDQNIAYLPIKYEEKCLMIQFTNDETSDYYLQELQQFIQPIFACIINNKFNDQSQMNLQKQYLFTKLETIFQQKYQSYSYTLIMHLLETQIQRTQNITQSDLYQRILKQEDYDTNTQNKLQVRKQIIKRIVGALNIVYKYSKQVKASYFKHFTRKFEPKIFISKEQKKALQQIIQVIALNLIRKAFVQFAIRINKYRYLQVNEDKKQYSLDCFAYNFGRILMRQSFKKLMINEYLQGYEGSIHEVGDLKLILEVKTLNQIQDSIINQKISQIEQSTLNYLNKQIFSEQIRQSNLAFNMIQKEGGLKLCVFEKSCQDSIVSDNKNMHKKSLSKQEWVIDWNNDEREHNKQKKALNKQQDKRPKTLSQLLRQVYFQGPQELQAQQVLPILILNQANTYKNRTDEYDVGKYAFFYQFKDNYIYNFDYSDTFIEELVQKSYVLEITSKTQKDEEDSLCQSDDEINNTHLKHDISGYQDYDNILRKQMDSQEIGGEKGKVKSVTNDDYDHIIYYPIVSNSNKGNVIAIVEVCYNYNLQSQQTFGYNTQQVKINNNKVKRMLANFKYQLQGFNQQVGLFCSKLSKMIEIKDMKQKTKAFSLFQLNKVMKEQQDDFENKKQEQTEQTEHYFNEYIKNLDSYDMELRKLVDEREQMLKKMKDMKVEKKAKLKFLASALFFCTSLERKVNINRIQNAMNQWKQNIYLTKIAESAFNKVLELNHKHSYARFKAGSYLLNTSFKQSEKKILKQCFRQIFEFVKFNSLKHSAMLYSTQRGQMINNNEHTQLFGNMRGSFNNNPMLSQPYQQMSNVSQGSVIMRESLDIGNLTSNSVYNQFPNQHSLSMVLSDVNSNKSNSKKSRSKSKKRL